jgi:HKD family nuclease
MASVGLVKHMIPSKIELIENRGPDNFRDVVNSYLHRATCVRIAVAFVTRKGVNQIIQPLRQVAAHGKVLLVAGLYQHVTEPSALANLFKVQKQSAGRFQIRISREPKFHKKIYLIQKRQGLSIFMGSSNLTAEGMRSRGETNIAIRSTMNSPTSRHIVEAFEKDWEYSVDLSPHIIRRYRSQRQGKKRTSPLSKKSLQRILGTMKNPPLGNTKRCWRDSINGFALKRTHQIIKETTDWEDRGYLWYSTGAPHQFQIGDTVFLFDKTDKRLKRVLIRDISRCKVSTPDGRHFVAYTHSQSTRRRLGRSLWPLLSPIGITARSCSERRKLGSGAIELLMKILRREKR